MDSFATEAPLCPIPRDRSDDYRDEIVAKRHALCAESAGRALPHL